MEYDDDLSISSYESTATSGASDDVHCFRNQIRVVNEITSAAALQMCSYLHIVLLLCHLVPLWTNRNPKKRKRQPNMYCNRSSVIEFIHTWSDDMFKRQFRLTRPDFFLLEQAIFENMSKKGYDLKKHYASATNSSGSPITLELRLYVTLRILSGASYLDMIWYGVEIRSAPVIFWKTTCDIDEAIDNINFPIDPTEIMQLVDNWAAKRKDRHGFTTNMGTGLALDGFVIEILKPDAKDLNGQEVVCLRNRKGFWGLISQLACDAYAKVRFVQTDWPGATNDISCFRGTQLFNMLKNKELPNWMHIVADEAYSPLSAECGGQILTPYSQHQLNSAKQRDWQNLQDWEQRMAYDSTIAIEKPIEEYWLMRAFNHELSSERITIERVIGMMVRRFGICWRPIEYHHTKVPTIFRVICKLHNICMDRWMMNNPAGARLGKFASVDSMQFSDDSHLFDTFDITVGLDDVFEQPSDEDVMERLQNRYVKLADRRRVYAARNIPLRDSLAKELYSLGIRFNKELEIY